MKALPLASLILYCFLLMTSFTACNSKNSGTSYQPQFADDTLDENTLIFGFPSISFIETAMPMIDYLNAHLSGVKVKLKACVTYDEYMDDLKTDKLDITFISGIGGIKLESHGYSIVGKVSDDNSYTGAIFIKKDPAIKKPADLKGKRIGIVPSKVMPGTMMPLYYLYQNGLNVNDDIVRVEASSFESAIITTYMGKTDAGVCLKRSWDVYVKSHPETLNELELKWETPPQINNALLVKEDIDSKIIAQITDVLFSMHTTPEGRAALSKVGVTGMEKANSDTYKPMMEFKRKYDDVID
ncbi:MAG: phosphate/phosphite/phosphonate ABC transporter substrate-binding protein [Bacteroidota bacterium]